MSKVDFLKYCCISKLFIRNEGVVDLSNFKSKQYLNFITKLIALNQVYLVDSSLHLNREFVQYFLDNYSKSAYLKYSEGFIYRNFHLYRLGFLKLGYIYNN